MSQSKKFIDRFRTQIMKQSSPTPGQKSQRQIHASNSSQLRSFYAQQQAIQQEKVQNSIIDKLQKHIEFLEKKLKDAQREMENLANNLEQSLRRLAEKDVELQNTLQQLEQKNRKVISLQDTNLFLKNQYQSFKLRTKMEKLSGQVTNKKEFIEKLEQKHSRKQKGRFSSAFLPSSFNGQSKYTQRKAEDFQAIIQQYQVKNIQETAFININNLTQSLTIQYRKLQQDYQKSQEELSSKIVTINQLNQTIKNLQQNIEKMMKRQPETVNNEKCQQQTQSDNNKIQVEITQNVSSSLKMELAISKQENKRLLEKIKQSEERMVEISEAIKETTDLELNNMFPTSISQIQLPQIKTIDRLNISKSVVDLKVFTCDKIEKEMQTDLIQEAQRIEILQEKMPFPSDNFDNSPISEGSASFDQNSQIQQAEMFEKLEDQIEKYFQRRQSLDKEKDTSTNIKEVINGLQAMPFEISAQRSDTQEDS